MSEKSFISPINMGGPFINRCNLYVRPSVPEDGAPVSCNVTIDVPDEREVLHEEGGYRLNHSMEVAVSLSQATGDGDTDLMRVQLSMSGTISIPDEVEVKGMTVEYALLLNGVSLFYSAARSYIESVTAMSSMGRFTIPAIDPSAYLENIGER